MRNTLTLALATPLAALCLGLALLSGAPARAEEGALYLFVQSAEAIRYDGNRLTLSGVADTTVFFTDRPVRSVGHLPTAEFVELWDEGAESFAAVPPNATLSMLQGDEVVNVVLELSQPRYEAGDFSYAVKVTLARDCFILNRSQRF